MPAFLNNKTRKIGIGLLVLLLIYAAAGFWWAPRLIRAQLTDFAQVHWQRQPAVGDIHFNPFTFTLDVRDFAFNDARGEAMLGFKELRVNLSLASLWRRGASFEAIDLDQPRVRAWVSADGRLNLNELAAPFAAAPTAAPAADEPARLFMDEFRLRGGQFEFEDRTRATPFRARLTPVNFELRDFSTVAGSDNRYSLQAQSPAGESFRWNGNFALAPLRSRGNFELSKVQARTLWSYLEESLPYEVASGLVALSGDYEFAATEPDPSLKITLATVQLEGLGLRPRGGAEDWIQLGRLGITDTRIDLARRSVSLARVLLQESTVLAQRSASGDLNLLSLFEAPVAGGEPEIPVETPAASTADASAEPAAAPWSLTVAELAVEGLRVTGRDEFVRPAASFTLSPVNLKASHLSLAPDQALQLQADLTVDSGGKLQVSAQGTPWQDNFAADLTLEGLNLAAFQPYVSAYTQMTLRSGSLSTNMKVERTPGSWRITGGLDCAQLHTVDDALREDFVKWERLVLSGVEYRTATGRPDSLRIGGIDARAPYLRLIIAPDQSTNVSKVLARPASAPGPVQTVRADAPPAATPPPAISIDRVTVTNGSANFADFWITPNYAVSVQQLGGTITGLSSRKDSRARVALNGKIDRYAPMQILGELNLLSASLFTDLRVKFDGVELTSVTPYSGRFAGYRIEKGKLSVDVRYLVENRKLDAQQRFIIDQLTLGERVDSPDAVRLPLRLAVALLKDRNGVIDLGLPVTGSLDDPKFRIGPIVWKAFVNLLAGIATSPFKLLGGMFGGGEEVNLIDFDAGSASLDAAATEKLAALGKALRERPSLSLDVPAVFATEVDVPALASQALEQKLAALAQTSKQPLIATNPADRFELLLRLQSQQLPGVALSPALQALREVRARDRDPAAVSAANQELERLLRPESNALTAELQQLAQQRARAIQDALLAAGDVDPARVFMVAPSAQPAASGRARLTLSLK